MDGSKNWDPDVRRSGEVLETNTPWIMLSKAPLVLAKTLKPWLVLMI